MCQLLSSCLLALNPPFHTQLYDSGFGTLQTAYLLCQLIPCYQVLPIGRWKFASGHARIVPVTVLCPSNSLSISSSVQLLSTYYLAHCAHLRYNSSKTMPPPQNSEPQIQMPLPNLNFYSLTYFMYFKSHTNGSFLLQLLSSLEYICFYLWITLVFPLIHSAIQHLWNQLLMISSLCWNT